VKTPFRVLLSPFSKEFSTCRKRRARSKRAAGIGHNSLVCIIPRVNFQACSRTTVRYALLITQIAFLPLLGQACENISSSHQLSKNARNQPSRGGEHSRNETGLDEQKHVLATWHIRSKKSPTSPSPPIYLFTWHVKLDKGKSRDVLLALPEKQPQA
jgi:hypothetical protein